MSSSNNTNKTNVPEAKEAMNRFKMEVANEIGVPLSVPFCYYFDYHI